MVLKGNEWDWSCREPWMLEIEIYTIHSPLNSHPLCATLYSVQYTLYNVQCTLHAHGHTWIPHKERSFFLIKRIIFRYIFYKLWKQKRCLVYDSRGLENIVFYQCFTLKRQSVNIKGFKSMVFHFHILCMNQGTNVRKVISEVFQRELVSICAQSIQDRN